MPRRVFAAVLNRYYEGKRCEKTQKRLAIRQEKKENRTVIKELVVTNDNCIMLGDTEVKMEPLVKAVYLLFLGHPEGIVFKALPEYRNELTSIYANLKPNGLTEKESRSIEDVTNPLSNSINEKCSRIRQAFLDIVEEELLHYYIVSGKSGAAKQIVLPRDMVHWE